jgi:adenylate cyclase
MRGANSLPLDPERLGPRAMNETKSDNTDQLAPRNTKANLERLLGEIDAEPGRRGEITREIETIFGQDRAVLVLDMSGFSRTTRQQGIVSFLLMIHQMQLLAAPSISGHGGLLIKAEADNLFCLFDDVSDAVRAGRDIVQRLDTVNLLLPEARRLYASIGIGYGRILNVGDEDLYGDEVNLASKLGEDVAGKGVILLTDAARWRLGDPAIVTRHEELNISGLKLSYHVVES